ncbi:L-asparaginase precursor [Luteitalea pratensis]|uniref:L-asparaginase n=1 Tax=Luteitalea pratensis TaxID=1855912 RepID=A0A143PUP8_LUTPR|nr:asparaginase [Luteitalea pratensis]AMY12467.1 L-asparaginase precursor [Luteitalea pratensis]
MRKISLSALLCLVTVAMPAMAGQGAAPSTPAAVTQPATTPASPLPRVRLVATGGTISNRRGGRLTAAEIVASVPGLADVAAVESEQFANVASAEITLDQWLALARRLNAIFRDDPSLSGIVVTSGTDTLEELAYFLHLTVRDRRPVVVTGSMRNPSQVGYEGPANLLASVRVAADARAAGRGVLVVLNDEINGARDVTKTDALRLNTFASRSFGALGVVDADRVVFRRTAEGRHTAASEFDVGTIETLPRVDVFLVYQGAPGDLIKTAIDLGARGVVLATAGAGATSGTQDQGVAYAREKGVPVVATTRAGSGRVAGPRDRSAATGSRRIVGGDLSAVKARVLLMLALTRTTEIAELQRIFEEY